MRLFFLYIACIGGLLFSGSAVAQNKYHDDFLEFWNDYNTYYAYFEKQGIDWDKVKEIYLPATDTIKSDSGFITFLEQVINELHNGHASLNTNQHTSNRIIPSGSDLFAEKQGNVYIVTDVKEDSGAKAAGIRPGMQIIGFNNKDIDSQLKKLLPKFTSDYTPAMYSYALNMLLAGTWNKPREITVISDGKEQKLYPDNYKAATSEQLLEYKVLESNIGYIKINNSLGNNDLIKEFDNALDKLMDTQSLILDLTDTPGGGNTTVARGIMGRFTKKYLPYQKHVIEEKQYGTVRSWVEYVTPRGAIYDRKLIVMAGHWTGSMGEGMAIGFDAMKRAKIVGTKMAGLLGAIYTFSASNTKIGYQIAGERMYHVNETPREDYIPPYLTDNSQETYQKALKLAK